ncbi:MAG: MFS transporter [Alcaligenaceae bacterium]|nr:MFS transporter [Alcaligenaceae bacterium]
MSAAGPQTTSRLGSALNPGVGKRELWAWAMYDFANSGYTTVVLTTVFSAYFVGVVAAGRDWGTLAFTSALSLSYLVVMLTMPTLGARADAQARRRRFLFISTAGCVAGTAMLALAWHNDIAIGLLALAISNYCYCVGESLIAAFLPEIARPEALGRVSGWGWSLGYFGGMLALGLALVIAGRAEAAGLPAESYVPWVMLLTALIFAVAALPAFLFLRERGQATQRVQEGLWRRLGNAWRDTHAHFPDFRRLLICGACYQAGIAVVVTLAAVYASEAMGFTMAQTMMLVFTVNIAAAVGAFSFGHFQDRIGHKPALAITLAGWILMVLVACVAVQPWVFWLAATLAGLCMGTSQSAGRAMVGAFAPPRRLAEFFSLWTFAIQLAAVVGPLFYGVVTWVSGGNHRLALLLTGSFFVLGLMVLARVDFDRGMRARQDAAGAIS